MPRKGERATPAQKAALARGQAKRDANRAKRNEPGYVSRAERWAMLLDGQLTMRDLSDAEIRRRQVADSAGSFVGSNPVIPSHLLAAFDKEMLRRTQDIVRKGGNKAIKYLLNALDSSEVDEKDKIAVAKYLADRYLGKTPETLHVKSDDWAGVVGEAVEVERGLSVVEDYANQGE